MARSGYYVRPRPKILVWPQKTVLGLRNAEHRSTFGHRMTRATRLLTVACIALPPLVLSSSCSLTMRPHQPRSMMYSSKELAIKPNRIRLQMRGLVEPFTGEIEHSADVISAGTPDISVKRAAIRWKIEGVPALRTALFQPNPFSAVADTWVLMYQMANYFESGPGRTDLGPAAPHAVDTCLRMEDELNQLAATFLVSRDTTKVRVAVKKWAMDHPIRYAIRDRETIVGRLTEQDVGLKGTAGDLIAEVDITADDVNREIQIYSAQLFRQASWEAELLKLDFPTSEVLPMAERAVKTSEHAVNTLDDLAPTIKTAVEAAATTANAATKLTSDLPTLVASERKAAVEAINEDLRKTLTFLHGERIVSFEQISRERIAVLQQLDMERMAAAGELREIATNERMALGRDIEQAGLKIVDHALWRLSELTAIILACLFLAGVIFLFIIRRLFFSSRQPPQLIRRDLPRGA